jgi:tetratricopeptide (TPR) repeat protein
MRPQVAKVNPRRPYSAHVLPAVAPERRECAVVAHAAPVLARSCCQGVPCFPPCAASTLLAEAEGERRAGDALRALGRVFIPFIVYVACVALLGDWIIDDAGISFAYSRNLATGHGFVAQPGLVPVEGFSNFLWVLLYVPFFWLGAFDPIWLPKVVAALLVLVSLRLVYAVLRQTTGKAWPGWVAASFIAMAPAVVIWTASGLENSLLLLLVVALWAVTTLRPRRWELGAGVLAAAMAMTRPDGLVYAAAVPLLCALEVVAARTKWRESLMVALRALGAFGLLWGPFLAFRLLRFGLPFPHTYYAKLTHASQGERLKALLASSGSELRAKLWGLGEAFAGPAGPWLLAGGLVIAAVLCWKRQLPRPAAAALALLCLASFTYIWLPDDWMGEFRFATPAVVTAWIAGVALVHPLMEWAPVAARRNVTAGVVGIGLALAVIPDNVSRLVQFAGNPPTSYRSVQRHVAEPFNAYADALGVTNGSILVADIGATLMESRLRVYDAAGLIEPRIIQTLRAGTPVWHYDHPEFYRWIFEEVRPTFIVTYVFWTNVTTLEYDPRFVRDYVALDSFPDEYVKAVYGRDVHSGEFVRRDALKTPDALRALRSSHAIEPLAEPFVYRVGTWLSSWGSGAARSTSELRREAAEALSHADRNPNRAATQLARLLDAVPDDLLAREQLASVLDRAGRAGEAHAQWQHVARLAAAQRDPARAARAWQRLEPIPEAAGLVSYARRVLATDRKSDARPALERAITLEPGAAAPHFWLGVLAQDERRLDDAVNHYRRCLELDPSFVDAQNNLGFTLSLLGHHDEAVPILESAVRRQPNHALARANLAWARFEFEHGHTEPASARR